MEPTFGPKPTFGQGAASGPEPDLPGLSGAEVAARVASGRTNAFRPSTGRTYRAIVRDNLVTPFNVVLAVLLGCLIALGQFGDTFASGGVVVLNTVVGLVQELRAKRTLDQLARLAAGTVRVRRDGVTAPVSPEELVADDVVELLPGDRLVVDGPCLWQDALELDESPISGESDAVAATVGARLTSGSFVVAGRGFMRAERVGEASFVNRLGQTAAGYARVRTPIERVVDAIVELSVVVMLVFAPLVFIQGHIGQVAFVDQVRNAVVLVTTFVPQGIVLATTVALSYGAIRIGRRRTLVQRINAVESLGNVTVLCFDKTGTLTENRLELREVVTLSGTPDEAAALLAWHVGSLAAPNRTALAIAGGLAKGTPEARLKVREVPFSSGRRWGAVTGDDGQTTVLGAPDALLANPAELDRANALAAHGLRVVALATTPAEVEEELPAGLRPVALAVLRDATRKDVAATLEELAGQGVQPKVISGDSLETVVAVARAAGMSVRSAMTGAEVDGLDDPALVGAVQETTVFARVAPQTKRRIVAALARAGEYVAMVGDGVNDVPALKEARLGIAMADGAQMARDVSDLVLLDNSLATLPLAMGEGRRTTQRVHASVRMLLAKNAYLVLAVILVGFMALPFPGEVRQLSWITVITSGVPSLLVSFGILRPRPMPRLDRDVLGPVLIAGVVGAIALSFTYVAAYFASGHDTDLAQSCLSLMALLYGTLVFLDVHGIGPGPRPAGAWLPGLIGLLMILVGVTIPTIQPTLFRLEPLPPGYLAGLAGGFALAALVFWRANGSHSRLLEPLRVLARSGRD